MCFHFLEEADGVCVCLFVCVCVCRGGGLCRVARLMRGHQTARLPLAWAVTTCHPVSDCGVKLSSHSSPKGQVPGEWTVAMGTASFPVVMVGVPGCGMMLSTHDLVLWGTHRVSM